MITLEKITKDFRVHRRDPGLKNAVRSLFARDTTVVRALNEVSFSIGDGEMVGYMGPNGADELVQLWLYLINSNDIFPDNF